MTVVDGVQGLQQLDDHEEVAAQITVADILLLSKSDLADAATTQRLRDALAAINPAGHIRSMANGAVDPDDFFADRMSSDERARRTEITSTNQHHDGHHHGAIATCSIVHEAAVEEHRLRAWLRMIVTLRPYALLRAKGYVNIREADRPLLVQTVGPVVSPPEFVDAWPGGRAETRLVLIFKGLDPKQVSESFHRHVIAGSA